MTFIYKVKKNFQVESKKRLSSFSLPARQRRPDRNNRGFTQRGGRGDVGTARGLIQEHVFFFEGTTRAEDAQGTPTQSHITPSILVYEDEKSAKENSYTQVSSRSNCVLIFMHMLEEKTYSRTRT